MGVFVWEVNRWWCSDLWKCSNNCMWVICSFIWKQELISLNCAYPGERGKSQMKQKYCTNIHVLCLQVQAVFAKCTKKRLAAHLATHSSLFCCHIKNHPVTAGLVLSQDLTVEANGNKFRLCCLCGAPEEVMERYRAAANLLQDSLQSEWAYNQLHMQRFRT